jgi:hypothetical protein
MDSPKASPPPISRPKVGQAFLPVPDADANANADADAGAGAGARTGQAGMPVLPCENLIIEGDNFDALRHLSSDHDL